MQKKVYIIHGWDGSPEEGWFPWLKKELESRGFSVFIPRLPQSDEPRINNWVPAIRQAIDNPDEQTYLIGHSMGCQAIARYLETLPDNIKIGGVVFVAGYFKSLSNLEDDEIVRDVAKEWLTTPIDLVKVKNHFDKSTAIFSSNDRYVPAENQNDFKDILKSKIIIENNKGHFAGDDKITELLSVLESILKLSE